MNAAQNTSPSEPERCDMLVVGGSPGGSTLAALLGENVMPAHR